MILVALPCIEALAQRSLSQVSLEHATKANILNRPAGQPDVSLAATTLQAELLVPIFIKSTRTLLLPGLSYAATWFGLNGVNAYPDPGGPWHNLTLTLGVVQSLPRRWRLAITFRPGLASDFKNVSSDDLRFSGAVMAMHALNPKLTMGFGLVGNYSFGDFLPLPGFFLDWRPGPSLRLWIILPRFLQFSYTWRRRIEVGVRMKLSGSRITIRGRPNVDNARCSQIDGGAYVALRLFSQLWLSLYGGVPIYRRFDLFNAQGGKVAAYDTAFTGIVNAGLEFRFPPGPRLKKVR